MTYLLPLQLCGGPILFIVVVKYILRCFVANSLFFVFFAPIWEKQFWLNPCSCKKLVFFHVCPKVYFFDTFVVQTSTYSQKDWLIENNEQSVEESVSQSNCPCFVSGHYGHNWYVAKKLKRKRGAGLTNKRPTPSTPSPKGLLF